MIFDGLTRLRGLTSNWREVDLGAERLFGPLSTYLALPVHTIYTVPPAILPGFAEPVRVLPMIAVRDREGRPHAAGLAAAREMVRRRVPDAALDEMFGAAEREARGHALIEATGGVPRDLLGLLRGFVSRESTDAFAFGRDVSLGLEVYRRLLWQSDRGWLGRVHAARSLVTAPGDEAAAARALANGAVVPYDGEAPWWDLHPAVLAVLEEAGASVPSRGGA